MPRSSQPGGDRVAIGAEREARRLHSDRGKAGAAVAPVPLGQVGQRSHAVELGEVEEVDEHGPSRGQRRHRVRRFPDPLDSSGQARRGDVLPFGAHPGTLSGVPARPFA